MATPAEITALIKRKALAYALANGGTAQDGAALGDTLVGIGYVESGLGQQLVGDGGQSHGIFHTHVGGRNLSGIGQRAGSAQQLAAALADPNLDIDNSLPELWQHFRRHGGAAGYQNDPNGFVANVALTGQRPDRGAWQSVVAQGGYARGVQIARGAPAPTGGSPLQAAAGLPSGAANVSASAGRTTAPSVNRTPVQGGITSRFGTPFPMDSGATYNGQAYPHFNKGVDFGAAGGSPVTAVVGGTVKLAADDGSGWGPRVVIVDQEGFEHSYGHLDAQSVAALRPGAQVQAGQQIGAVASGRVGTSTGSHLSYDVFKGGEPVDPSPWLGQDVREPGIPASRQTPTYLSGAGAAGGTTAMAQQSGGSSFYQDQLAAAQAEYEKLQTREAELRAKGANLTPEEKNELYRIGGIPGDDTPGARDAALARVMAIQKAINDIPSAQSADPVQQASAVAGIRAQQNEHSRWIFDTFTGLIDATFKNQLGVANAMSTIMQANEANVQAAVASRVRNHEISSADAMNIVQAEAMKQAAEAARFGQAMQLAGMINENDWKIAERRLPPGTKHVPLLGPDDPLAQVMRRVNIEFPGIAVTPTDFDKLDLRKTMADAEQIVPGTVPLSIDNLQAQYGASKNLPVYNPREITPEAIGLPYAPNLASADVLGQIPGASQAGGVDDDDLINRILGRGPYAPQPPPQAPPRTQVAGVAGSTGTPPIGSQFPMTPGTTTVAGQTQRPQPNAETGPEGAGSSARLDTQQGPSGARMSNGRNPLAPLYGERGEQVDDEIIDFLKKIGFSAAGGARTAAGSAVQGVKDMANPRKWLR